MENDLLVSQALDIDLWQIIDSNTDFLNINTTQDLFKLKTTDFVLLLPEMGPELWVKIQPLFRNIERFFKFYKKSYCTLFGSDLVLGQNFSQICVNASPKYVFSFGVCADIKNDKIIHTRDLKMVGENPLLKKQVFLDVREKII